MKISEIKKKAKEIGINPCRMKKVDLIRAIQKKEGNIECFATVTDNNCAQLDCCWREDCLK
jgi:hypothetical protein